VGSDRVEEYRFRARDRSRDNTAIFIRPVLQRIQTIPGDRDEKDSGGRGKRGKEISIALPVAPGEMASFGRIVGREGMSAIFHPENGTPFARRGSRLLAVIT